MSKKTEPKEGTVIYCRFIRRNGRIIYPKNARFFKFVVKKKK